MDSTSEASYADFVRTRWRDLVRAGIFLGASPDEAEDLAQQTLVRCYANWQRVTDASNRDAYVYRMLLNQLRDARRTRWWRGRVDAKPDGSVDDASNLIVSADAVHQALDGLSKANRDVVVLRYFVGLPCAQTATAVGMSLDTVKRRLAR